MTTERERIIETLEAIVATDRSESYEYGEPRPWDGEHPGPGKRWNTPREIARAELRRLREDRT